MNRIRQLVLAAVLVGMVLLVKGNTNVLAHPYSTCGSVIWRTVADSGLANMYDEREIDAFLQADFDSVNNAIYCGAIRSGATVYIFYNSGVNWCHPDWHNWYQNANLTHFQDWHNVAGQCTPANPANWKYQTIGNWQAQSKGINYQGVAYFDTWPSWANSYVNVVTPWWTPCC